MNKQQYEAAHRIMGFCRVFIDQMNACLKNSGLKDLGYELCLDLMGATLSDGSRLNGSIYLQRFDNGKITTDWLSQRNIEGKGWVIGVDYFAETGSLPENARWPVNRDDRTGEPKAASKPYPPDGLWISSYDDPPVLDSWEPVSE